MPHLTVQENQGSGFNTSYGDSQYLPADDFLAQVHSADGCVPRGTTKWEGSWQKANNESMDSRSQGTASNPWCTTVLDRETTGRSAPLRILPTAPTKLGRGLRPKGVGDSGADPRHQLSWSRVTKTERVDCPEWVYDLTTETGNFIADGIVVHNCHHGIDLNLYTLCTQKEDFLLYLARVQDEKGALEFVGLCKSVGMKGMLAGEDIHVPDPLGYPRRAMEACEQSGGLVRYLGRVPFDYKLELLQTARCLVAPLKPPYIEIFGLSTIESLACGTPVLSTDRGAARELLVHGTTGAIAQDISCLEKNLAIALQCQPEACRRQAEGFSREKMASEYLKLYRRMIEDNEEW